MVWPVVLLIAEIVVIILLTHIYTQGLHTNTLTPSPIQIENYHNFTPSHTPTATHTLTNTGVHEGNNQLTHIHKHTHSHTHTHTHTRARAHTHKHTDTNTNTNTNKNRYYPDRNCRYITWLFYGEIFRRFGCYE